MGNENVRNEANHSKLGLKEFLRSLITNLKAKFEKSKMADAHVKNKSKLGTQGIFRVAGYESYVEMKKIQNPKWRIQYGERKCEVRGQSLETGTQEFLGSLITNLKSKFKKS